VVVMSVIVIGAMGILGSCRITRPPIDEGAETWKCAGCSGQWAGFRHHLRPRGCDGREVVEVVLVVWAMLLLLLLVLWWLKAGASGLIVDWRLKVCSGVLRGCTGKFARCGGLFSHRRIATWAGS